MTTSRRSEEAPAAKDAAAPPAKQVLVDQLFQILVSGCNDAYVDFNRGNTADAIELTITQYS